MIEPKNPIDFIHPSVKPSLPVPYIRSERRIHQDFYDFLVVRKHYPHLLGAGTKSVGLSAITQKASRIRLFLESLLEDESKGLDYTNVSYPDIKKWIERQNSENSDSTFNGYLSDIREFYAFLDYKGVRNNAFFPDKTIRSVSSDSSQDLLSSTHNGRRIIESEPDAIATPEKEDYCEEVFSIAQEKELIKKLTEIDPVYAVMTKVMIQTFLRRINICEMPFRKSDNGKNNFYLYPEMIRLKRSRQSYSYLSKGKKSLKMPIFIHTWQLIYDEYINKYYDDRIKLYREVASKRKNFTPFFHNYDRKLPDDILWLKKNGHPVKPNDLNNAFLKAGLGIRPHHCRHTGITRTMDTFCQIHGVEVSEALTGRFVQILKQLCGHASAEATLKYIHTLENQQTTEQFLNALPENLEDIEDAMKPFVSEQVFALMKQSFYSETA